MPCRQMSLVLSDSTEADVAANDLSENIQMATNKRRLLVMSKESVTMSKEEENKAIIGRWLKAFWGNPWDPAIIDELAAPDLIVHAPAPIHTPGQMIAPPPTHTSSPISTALPDSIPLLRSATLSGCVVA